MDQTYSQRGSEPKTIRRLLLLTLAKRLYAAVGIKQLFHLIDIRKGD